MLVSSSNRFIARAQMMASEFKYVFQSALNINDLCDTFSNSQIHFLVISTEEVTSKDEAVGTVQVARQIFPDCFIMVIMSAKLDPTAITWIRKSGADVVILDHEFFDTSKLEFFAFQSVRSDYRPVKSGDLIEGTSLTFNIYHFLPQNRKYLPVVHKNIKLEEKRIKKMREVGDVYIKRNDIPAYFKYMDSNEDASAKGMIRRCRAQFLTLSHSYIDLVITLTEQTDNPSFEEGKKVLQVCLDMSANLLNSLMTVGNIQDIVESPQEGDFGSIERSVDRAAMAGFFSLMGSLGKPEEVMLGALLMDIGIISLSPMVLKKARLNLKDTFLPEELNEYQMHPQRSLNYALSRKLQLSNATKDAILNHHVSNDNKGFPVLAPGKFGVEAQLLRFCFELDDKMRVYLGRPKPQFIEVFRAMVKEISDFRVYTPAFVTGMREVLSSL
jgi:hypothetical protein